MPYVNDRLESQKIESAKQEYKRGISRTSRFKFDPQGVMDSLYDRIIGQDHMLDIIENMLYTVKADFGPAHRPLSIILFLGPTGVGKTETVRALSESILGSSDLLCRIDMNTLAQAHYSAAITGSPPGYVGSKEGQTLFDAQKITGGFSHPGIVLFDEIEKADDSVVNTLLNIFDSGKLTLTSGDKELDFRNCLIFMTSNLGAKALSQSLAMSNTGWKRLLQPLLRKSQNLHQDGILDKALHQHFQPEFLNRIDSVINFNELDEKQLESLIDKEISLLNLRLKKRDARVTLSSELHHYFSQLYDIRFGARDIARHLRTELEPKIARAIISHSDTKAFKAQLDEDSIVVLPDD